MIKKYKYLPICVFNILALLLCFICPINSFAYEPPLQESYKIELNNGNVFIMLGKEAHLDNTILGTNGNPYINSGLYENSTIMTPSWIVDDYIYESNLFFDQNPNYYVVIYRIADYNDTAPKGISFFNKGNLTASYLVEFLVTDFSSVQNLGLSYDWIQTSMVKSDYLYVVTRDKNQYKFVIKTGSILHDDNKISESQQPAASVGKYSIYFYLVGIPLMLILFIGFLLVKKRKNHNKNK